MKKLNNNIDGTHGGFKNTIRALRHRNFRLFFIGQSISLIGIWMQSVAISWLVFRLTNSSFMLGIVAFSGQIPAFLFSPFAGVMIDRFDRRQILKIMLTLSMLQALLLSFVTLTGTVQVWHIILLTLFLGLVNAFDIPARQAFVIELIEDKADLGNAIALNSSLFNASRLIGPTIAGVLIGTVGEGICFLINGISYIAALAALFAMDVPLKQMISSQKAIFSEMKDGLRYTVRFIPIRDLIIFISFMSLVGMSFPVILPIFATNVLHGNSHTFGFLISASGIGAVAGTIYLASRKNVLGLDKIIAVSVFIFSTGIIALSFSTSLILSLILLAVIGFGMIAGMASCNTIVQTIVEEEMRGRVMSFYIMAFIGAAPIGSLLAGAASDNIGVQSTLMAGGLITAVCGTVFVRRLPILREKIRPVYKKKGIIPEIALGIQSASVPPNPED